MRRDATAYARQTYPIKSVSILDLTIYPISNHTLVFPVTTLAQRTAGGWHRCDTTYTVATNSRGNT